MQFASLYGFYLRCPLQLRPALFIAYVDSARALADPQPNHLAAWPTRSTTSTRASARPSRATAARTTACRVASSVRASLLLCARTQHPSPLTDTGSGAFIGLGLYSYFSGRQQLRQRQAAILRSGSQWGIHTRRLGINAIASLLVGLGLWRLVN